MHFMVTFLLSSALLQLLLNLSANWCYQRLAGYVKERRTKENKEVEIDVLRDYLRKHGLTIFLAGINLPTKHPCMKRQWKENSVLDQCQFFVAPLLEVQKN